LIATFNSLLLIAEAEAGSVRESMETFSLGEVIEGIGELYGPLADEKSLNFTVNKPPGAATIRGNQNLISQAVANLVDNAIKYTPEGGSIVVGLEQSADGPQVVVSDTGPGIPPDERLRVTDRFVRLESSRNSPGTGLGLSLVAAVARLHDAELALEDNRPGLRAVLRFKSVEAAVRPAKAASRAEPRVEPVH
jgi:signal transduction histidine kinase